MNIIIKNQKNPSGLWKGLKEVTSMENSQQFCPRLSMYQYRLKKQIILKNFAGKYAQYVTFVCNYKPFQ